MYLDATQTKFEQSFKLTAEKYPGAINSSLEDKPVLVLVVKGVDTYSAKAGDGTKILNIAGYEIEFKISEDDGNIIEARNNGLFATTAVAGAVQGNIAVFDTQTVSLRTAGFVSQQTLRLTQC